MESYVTQEFRKSNYWQEVSVLGYIYDCDFTRSLSRRKVRNRIFVLQYECCLLKYAFRYTKTIPECNNELVDGSMMDFGDCVMLWRTADALSKGMVTIRSISVSHSLLSQKNYLCLQNSYQLAKSIDALNETRPICPVLFNRLWFAKGSEPLNCGHKSADCACVPYVNLTCGHVQGNWIALVKNANNRHITCPVCRADWKAVKLSIGMETAFWVDGEPPTHCFNPCGHVASERTVKYANF